MGLSYQSHHRVDHAAPPILNSRNHSGRIVRYRTDTGGTSCASETGKVVLNWRWVHKVGDYTNCYTGNEWDASLCPDNATCATNYALEGGDYLDTYVNHTVGEG